MNRPRKDVGLFDHPDFGWGEIRLDFIQDVVDAEHGGYTPPKCKE
jgi:hypothetical protein